MWERRQHGGHGIIHQNLTETLIRLTKSQESFSQEFPDMREIQMFVVIIHSTTCGQATVNAARHHFFSKLMSITGEHTTYSRCTLQIYKEITVTGKYSVRAIMHMSSGL